MLTKSPEKMQDIRALETGLADSEKRLIHERARQIAMLGAKWLLHKDNAPKKGTYNHAGTRLA